MKDRNRYGSYSQKKLPREKRTIPLSGSLEDDGQYFRCWNCGFINDKDKATVETGDHGTGGVVPTVFTDEDGESLYYPLITKGCAFCGSTNYR